MVIINVIMMMTIKNKNIIMENKKIEWKFKQITKIIMIIIIIITKVIIN